MPRGKKVGHRRQVRRSDNRWRIRWLACGKKQGILVGRTDSMPSDWRAQRRCCISCGARFEPALAEGFFYAMFGVMKTVFFYVMFGIMNVLVVDC